MTVFGLDRLHVPAARVLSPPEESIAADDALDGPIGKARHMLPDSAPIGNPFGPVESFAVGGVVVPLARIVFPVAISGAMVGNQLVVRGLLFIDENGAVCEFIELGMGVRHGPIEPDLRQTALVCVHRVKDTAGSLSPPRARGRLPIELGGTEGNGIPFTTKPGS